MKRLLIFGAGDGGCELVEIIHQINRVKPFWEIVGFIEKSSQLVGKTVKGYKVMDGENMNIEKECELYGICGVMNPLLRKKITDEEIVSRNIDLATIVHPSSNIATDFIVSLGTIIFPGVKISHGVKMGTCCFLNFNVVIGHGVEIGSFNYISPGVIINAECNIGDYCVFGSGAVLVPRISVGEQSIIGIGTTLLDNVSSKTRVVDMPRRIVKEVNS